METALEAWQRAIERCQSSEANLEQQAQVVEIFRQRAREARRGPGVLRARSLLNRGEQAEAIALLELLLQQDPQWQPLRSLLEQARPAASINASGNATAPNQRAAGRAGTAGAAPAATGPAGRTAVAPAQLPPERDAAAAEQLLQHGLARLALLA